LKILLKMNDEQEPELPEGTTIRFEIGDLRISCKADEEGLVVRKTSVTGEDRIIIVGMSGNVIIVK